MCHPYIESATAPSDLHSGGGGGTFYRVFWKTAATEVNGVLAKISHAMYQISC